VQSDSFISFEAKSLEIVWRDSV